MFLPNNAHSWKRWLKYVKRHSLLYLFSKYTHKPPTLITLIYDLKATVICQQGEFKRQKGEFQNRGFKKTKHANFSEKRPFLTP